MTQKNREAVHVEHANSLLCGFLELHKYIESLFVTVETVRVIKRYLISPHLWMSGIILFCCEFECAPQTQSAKIKDEEEEVR